MRDLSNIEAFLDYLGDSVVISDENSNIVFTNKACQTLFNYSKSDMLNMTIESLIASSHIRPTHNKKLKRYIRSNSESTTIKYSTKSILVREALSCIKSDGKKFKSRISVSVIEIDSIRYGIAIIHDYSSVYSLINKLNKESLTDNLTGLFNKRYFNKMIRSKLEPNNVGIAYCDLANFKSINDTFGHDFGDQVLIEFSARLMSSLRNSDTAIRVGGDEFLIVFNISNYFDYKKDLLLFGELLTGITHSPIYLQSIDTYIELKMSIGLAACPYETSDIDEGVQLADKAMYYCKVNGCDYSLSSDIE
ncbi:GGDEF domain-containing protein [Vibrio sp. 99-70-13A1]|uniref:diguanylate cyclase n=1 Tax=Vibrio sp. 99-70-13A1 TaxID=2607601 RepID=UPI00149332C1|nr:diguanylate cyclase [Vibrio sp. 99-70-13A1]